MPQVIGGMYMSTPIFDPLPIRELLTAENMQLRAIKFLNQMSTRRSVRDFSTRSIPKDVIETCIRAAGTAPSGANLQPWHFVVVSDPALKKEIRIAAEAEEHEFYTRRATKEWLDALAPLGTDESKPYLEAAPYLVAIFVQSYGVLPDGNHIKHYYAMESVGIATGILIAALHLAGLATLTHTPSPMTFLKDILGRPENERPFLLLVTGYPSQTATVPRITKKAFDEISTFM